MSEILVNEFLLKHKNAANAYSPFDRLFIVTDNENSHLMYCPWPIDKLDEKGIDKEVAPLLSCLFNNYTREGEHLAALQFFKAGYDEPETTLYYPKYDLVLKEVLKFYTELYMKQKDRDHENEIKKKNLLLKKLFALANKDYDEELYAKYDLDNEIEHFLREE